jgi:beta-lactamase class A
LTNKTKNDFNTQNPWKRSIPIAYTLIIFLLSISATFFITKKVDECNIISGKNSESLNSEYLIKRKNGFKFIRPLISAKPVNEFDGYAEIKKNISDLILSYQDHGILSSASFYLRDFDKSNWTAVNVNDKYSPGSILKIPILMAVLKYAEKNPDYLNEVITNNIQTDLNVPVKQSILFKQIEFGKNYTRKELLKYMIEYSDNKAVQLLIQNLDTGLIYKLFEEYDLPKPQFQNGNNMLSAIEISIFLESLYNSTYLDETNSEYAIDLLTKTTFTDGIVKGIPESNLLIAHKFGESGTVDSRELHETAIVYVLNQPYLITIMTRGREKIELPQLEEVIQNISKEVYSGLLGKKSS